MSHTAFHRAVASAVTVTEVEPRLKNSPREPAQLEARLEASMARDVGC
jgi:hypothetical protein